MTRLSVNVNKLATLRNSRGKNNPDVAAWGRRILQFGAHGLTVHPRPDGRHIRLSDVTALSALVREWNMTTKQPVEFNVEGYPADEFLALMEQVLPDQATLVPDPPEAITSDAGWDLVANEAQLKQIVARLRKCKVRSSLFVDPKTFTSAQEEALLRIRPDRIELYTEAFAEHFGDAREKSVTAEYRRVAEVAQSADIGINAGHDLSQKNLVALVRAIPWLEEVSIGHALVCEALEHGMEHTVRAYLRLLENA